VIKTRWGDCREESRATGWSKALDSETLNLDSKMKELITKGNTRIVTATRESNELFLSQLQKDLKKHETSFINELGNKINGLD
jgi:hypothetical protein